VTPCARGSRSRERRPGITWGCPNWGNPVQTPITCHFCAMQRDLMCAATYVTLEHTRFARDVASPGRRQRIKPAFPGEIGLFRPLLGPFSSDFRNPVPASGHVCDLAASARPARTFSRVHRLRAHPFAGAPGRVAPGGSIEPVLGPACFRSVARNREQIDAGSGCRLQAA
jgi:hypothetical protein